METTRPTENRIQDNLREGWIAVVLIVLILFSVTGSVSAANWTDGLWVLTWTALAGMTLGAMLARVRAPGWLALSAAIVVCAFVTFYLLGELLPLHLPWNERVIVVETRIGDWIYRITRGGLGTDAFIFVFYTGVLSYFIGFVSAWFVFRRHQPWGAILPAGVGLLINLFYAPAQSSIYLILYLLASLLLLVRTNLVLRQSEWRRASVTFANDIAFDFLTYGLAFSALIVATSWVVPPELPGPQWFTGLSDIVYRPWRDLAENFSRGFSTLRGGTRTGPTTFFGQSLALGGPVRLGDQPVLDIESPAGRYWRATVFDRYTGVGWTASATELKRVAPNEESLAPFPSNMRREITQTVTVRFPDGDLLVAAAQPARLNLTTDIRYFLVRTNEGIYGDFTILRADHRLQAGAQYEVASLISEADEQSLRTAGTNYPNWVRERFLQLPDSLPQRVRDLAAVITAGKTNPYDRARALEDWLRANIIYDEGVAAPPPDRDGVDYTLFDRRQGYCNYYASAMAVLARSLGIPARLASGYTLGRADGSIYHIKESDAHTWPELYFEGYGWIEFEPTASKATIVRLERPASTPTADTTTNEGDASADSEARRNRRNRFEDDSLPPDAGTGGSASFTLPVDPAVAIVGGSAIGLFILGALALVALQLVWVLNVRKLPPASRAYAEIFRFARWLGLQLNRAHTPYEQAEVLKERLPDKQEEITRVSSLYVREQYSPHGLAKWENAQVKDLTTRINRRIRGAILARYVGRARDGLVSALKNLALLLHLRR